MIDFKSQVGNYVGKPTQGTPVAPPTKRGALDFTSQVSKYTGQTPQPAKPGILQNIGTGVKKIFTKQGAGEALNVVKGFAEFPWTFSQYVTGPYKEIEARTDLTPQQKSAEKWKALGKAGYSLIQPGVEAITSPKITSERFSEKPVETAAGIAVSAAVGLGAVSGLKGSFRPKVAEVVSKGVKVPEVAKKAVEVSKPVEKIIKPKVIDGYEVREKPYLNRTNLDTGGFVELYTKTGDKVASADFEMRGRRAVLPSIGISDKFADLRRKGIGTKLLKYIEESAKERGATEITTQVVHAPEFFAKNGYVKNPKNTSMTKQLVEIPKPISVKIETPASKTMKQIADTESAFEEARKQYVVDEINTRNQDYEASSQELINLQQKKFSLENLEEFSKAEHEAIAPLLSDLKRYPAIIRAMEREGGDVGTIVNKYKDYYKKTGREHPVSAFIELLEHTADDLNLEPSALLTKLVETRQKVRTSVSEIKDINQQIRDLNEEVRIGKLRFYDPENPIDIKAIERELSKSDEVYSRIVEKKIDLEEEHLSHKAEADFEAYQKKFLGGEGIDVEAGTGSTSQQVLTRKYSAARTKNDYVLQESVPMAYQGNKRGALGYIMDIMGFTRGDMTKLNVLNKEHLTGIKNMYDIFGGSGLLTTMFKKFMPWVKAKVGDFDPAVSEYYKQVKENPKLLKEYVKKFFIDQEKNRGFDTKLELEQQLPGVKDNPIYQVARKIWETNLSRVGKIISEKKLNQILKGVDNFNQTLRDSSVKSGKWDAIDVLSELAVRGGPEDFINIDPPYLLSSGYKAGSKFESPKGFIDLIDFLPLLNHRGVKYIFYNSEPTFVIKRMIDKINAGVGDYAKLSAEERTNLVKVTENAGKAIEQKIANLGPENIVVRNARPKGGEKGRLEMIITNSPWAKGLRNAAELRSDLKAMFRDDKIVMDSEWRPKDVLEVTGDIKEFVKKIVTQKDGSKLYVTKNGVGIPEDMFGNLDWWRNKGSSWLSFMRNTLNFVTNPAHRDRLLKIFWEPVKVSQAAMTMEHSNLLKRLNTEVVKELGINNKKLSSAVMLFGEGKMGVKDGAGLTALKKSLPEKWQNIVKADAWFRHEYDNLLLQVNDQLAKFGQETILRRNDYYTHFLEVSNLYDYFKSLGAIDPTVFADGTFFRRNAPFNPFSLKRTGDMTSYDAIEAFKRYLVPTLNQKYLTEHVIKARAMSDFIEAKTMELGNNTKLSRVIKSFREFADQLAGQTHPMDKAFRALSPETFSILDKVAGRFAKNRILGNFGSVIMQTAQLPMAMAKMSLPSFAKGMIYRSAELINGKDFSMERSNFLKARYPEMVDILPTMIQRGETAAAKLFELMESNVTKSIWRGFYEDAKSQGYLEPAAVHYAEHWTERIIQGRRPGDLPSALTSKTLGHIMMPFQVETMNFYSGLLQDFKGQGLPKGLYQGLKLVTGLYIMNEIYNSTIGRTPLPDPVRAINDAYDHKEEGALVMGGRILGELANVHPFGQAFIGPMVPDTIKRKYFGRTEFGIYPGGPPIISALGTVLDKLAGGKPLQAGADAVYNWMLPFGGSQVKKIIEGTGAAIKGGVYNKEGDLEYPVATPADRMRSIFFGKSSPSTAQMYYDVNSLNSDARRAYNFFIKSGYTPNDAFRAAQATIKPTATKSKVKNFFER